MKPATQLFQTADGRKFGRAFLLICVLFLISGVSNSMLDALNRHFQNSFGISKMKSALVQNAFYLGYFVMALPAGMVGRRLGSRRAMMIGLGIITVAAFWFIPATRIGTFWAFLAGLFALAVGFTCLETVMNPYATLLGPPETGATRINLAQSCNGLGWMIGPSLAGYFILSGTNEVNRSNGSLYIPYLLLGCLAAVMLVLLACSRLPELQADPPTASVSARADSRPARPLWQRWHFTCSILAQFCYVAAQTGIFGYFINYVVLEIPAVGAATAARFPAGMVGLGHGGYHLTDRGAATLLSVGGFGLFLVGRLTGSLALRVVKAHQLLALYSVANAAMMLCVVLRMGWISIGALLLSFFFMSIGYPTIFALGIYGLGRKTQQASSYLVMAILGGAFMPMLMGWLADHGGMGVGFLVPLILFLVVASYAAAWPRLHNADGA